MGYYYIFFISKESFLRVDLKIMKMFFFFRILNWLLVFRFVCVLVFVLFFFLYFILLFEIFLLFFKRILFLVLNIEGWIVVVIFGLN